MKRTAYFIISNHPSDKDNPFCYMSVTKDYINDGVQVTFDKQLATDCLLQFRELWGSGHTLGSFEVEML